MQSDGIIIQNKEKIIALNHFVIYLYSVSMLSRVSAKLQQAIYYS